MQLFGFIEPVFHAVAINTQADTGVSILWLGYIEFQAFKLFTCNAYILDLHYLILF